MPSARFVFANTKMLPLLLSTRPNNTVFCWWQRHQNAIRSYLGDLVLHRWVALGVAVEAQAGCVYLQDLARLWEASARRGSGTRVVSKIRPKVLSSTHATVNVRPFLSLEGFPSLRISIPHTRKKKILEQTESALHHQTHVLRCTTYFILKTKKRGIIFSDDFESRSLVIFRKKNINRQKEVYHVTLS